MTLSVIPQALTATGLSVERIYTDGKVHPYDTVNWKLCDAVIGNESGTTVFEQKNVDFPPWNYCAENMPAA